MTGLGGRHHAARVREQDRPAVRPRRQYLARALSQTEKKRDPELAGLKALVADITASYVEQTRPFVLADDRARLGQGHRKAGLPE